MTTAKRNRDNGRYFPRLGIESMGQALRRASGKLKNSGVNISPSSKQTVPNQTLEQVRNVERKSVYVDNRAGDANDPGE